MKKSIVIAVLGLLLASLFIFKNWIKSREPHQSTVPSKEVSQQTLTTTTANPTSPKSQSNIPIKNTQTTRKIFINDEKNSSRKNITAGKKTARSKAKAIKENLYH